ncbi:putative quinol monooxygenase [Sphingomonas nostoxanthinifaciens]|uniref:putative quinol monooxygenase n=1 Tax=Sphingomonas nostoxanthinifaciens TaxID=2872652 RepID=UPI001CC2201B|nr:putative quinol monooxygenase [Sphingomonas nostoxanthinifaciens]UAK23346.1 antibiotic biosynthesis monooxygenase [Sphingomonas nostoxanthinifaciens]
MPHVKITAILTARAATTDHLYRLLEDMAPHCRAEPGNMGWNVWRDRSDPCRYVLDELYADDDAVAAHRSSPHYQRYLSEVPALAERLAVISEPLLVG